MPVTRFDHSLQHAQQIDMLRTKNQKLEKRVEALEEQVKTLIEVTAKRPVGRPPKADESKDAKDEQAA